MQRSGMVTKNSDQSDIGSDLGPRLSQQIYLRNFWRQVPIYLARFLEVAPALALELVPYYS